MANMDLSVSAYISHGIRGHLYQWAHTERQSRRYGTNVAYIVIPNAGHLMQPYVTNAATYNTSHTLTQ